MRYLAIDWHRYCLLSELYIDARAARVQER
ncbi:hypothetical protein AWB76_04667 [Caballeronia temeraria]|uniref:Uncharacterized protein n=1 Tax=Caballeronia temeraria TaxID=1777137 RepID=A0A158BU01_9BURK|nr:hypothetical protein AWB76_04667 [Caballeronia temeraria]